jgi:c-di-GMP-binding flagellar brake protein YcgR
MDEGEKREYHRIVLNAFMRFYVESSSQLHSRYRQGIIKNYSRGGLFISTRHLLPKGSLVTMEIPVENAQGQIVVVQIRGVVRRFNDLPGQEGLGIEFFELKDTEHYNLQEWIANLLVD